MNESMPSRAQPPHAAQKPRTWLRVSRVGGAMVSIAREYTGGMVRSRLAPVLAASMLIAATRAERAAAPLPAETLLAAPILESLDQELSGVAAKDHVAHLAQLHRVPASPGFHDAVEYV